MIRRPTAPYWIVLARFDTAVVLPKNESIEDLDPEKDFEKIDAILAENKVNREKYLELVGKYNRTLNEKYLPLDGEPTRFLIEPPSQKKVFNTLGKYGVSPNAEEPESFKDAENVVDISIDFALSSIREIKVPEGDDPISPEDFKDLGDDILSALGNLVSERATISRRDLGL